MSPPAPRRSRARVRRRTAVASAVVLAGLLGRGRIEAQEPTPTVVRGVVFDSTSMRPLAGARVQLVSLPVVGGPRTVGTDSAGAFRFDSLAVGAYLVGFSHPRLDSVGFEPSLVRVNLRTPGTVTALLAVPSSRSLVRASCRIDPRVDSTGIYLGYVRSAVDGLPVPQASLRLEWPEFLLGRSGLERVTRTIDARANGSGGFLICGVPAATTVLVHAFAGADSSGRVELELPASGLLRRDLLVAPPPSAVDTTSTAARAPDRGDAPSRPPSISGVVRTVEGLPIAGARVGLLGAALEATTDDDGRFALVARTVGTRMVAARAIGFRPGRTVVDVTAAEIAAVDIVLAPADPAGSETPTALDTVRVSGISRLASSAIEVRRAFSRRVQSGVGMFLGDSAIRARHLHLPSELFRGMPGLTVTNGSGGQGVYMRANATFNATKGLCLPTVFIDGGRAPRAPVDQMTTVSQLRAVEIYPRSEQAPPQFQTSDGCGVIVLWTRTMWDATASPPSR